MKRQKSNTVAKLNLRISFAILVFLGGFSIPSWGSQIIYPWRATTAIVISGESFEVWFDADNGQTIDSVGLVGPYNSVSTSFSFENGIWNYDEWSGNTYNRKIAVQVPADAPADKYDLILYTSSGTKASLASVKVIKEYKSIYYVMHFSDPHRWEASKNTPDYVYPDQTTVIDIANIINPEIFIETGDSYWQTPGDTSLNQSRLKDIMEGSSAVRGLQDQPAALFIIPGNHDTPKNNYYKEPGLATPARAWNELFGLQTHCFKYYDTRFIGINNSWCPSTGGGAPDYVANYQWQLDLATTWIDTVGKGNLRVGFFHVPQESVPPLYYAFKNAGAPFGLLLGGHIHRYTTNPYSIDGNPIIFTAAGVKNGTNGAPFNLYKIDNIKGTFETVGNSYSAHAGLSSERNYSTSKLKLSYSNENDGSNANNTATIVSKFSFLIEDARVRFVLPKGVIYAVSNGTITQEFDGDNFHIIDTKIDLNAYSTTTVTVEATDYCPDDPNKTEPGNCGCGVVEGTCDKLPLVVNNGSGTGDYYPFEEVLITTHPAPKDMEFDKWVIDSGTPLFVDIQASSTTLHLGASQATITATYKEFTTIYQAEDAEYQGPTFATSNAGYHESGYLVYTNPYNDFIEWTVSVPYSGSYDLIFRYALYGFSRPHKLTVNGSVKESSLDFPATGSWTNWDVVSSAESLNAGENIIRLTAMGLSGSNMDELVIESKQTHDEIIYDDFESGYGNWYDGGDNCKIDSTEHAHQGLYAVNLESNTSSSLVTTDDLVLTGYDEILVEFWYKAIGIETNEDFRLQISTDGGNNYSTVKAWASGVDFENDTFYSDSLSITGYTLTNTTRLRFRCYAGDDDDIYLDEIRVSARSGGISAIDGDNSVISNRYMLNQNYPNPFNPTTSIQFSIPVESFVSLKVYDLLGREVVTLVDEKKGVGNYQVIFSANDLPSGIYFYSLQAADFIETKKLVLIK